MLSSTIRRAVVAGSVTLLMLGAPSESKAGAFDWLCPANWGRKPAPTTYAPPFLTQPGVCAPAYNPCAPVCTPCAPQTCYYVPQTYYRTTYRYAPVTSCCPVTGCDPCTGSAVTTYRPLTMLAYRPTLVPYTTYRIVYARPYVSGLSSACGPCGSYSPCGVGGVTYGWIGGAGGCSSCTAPPVTSSPVISGGSLAPPALPGSITYSGPLASGAGTSLAPPASSPSLGSPAGGTILNSTPSGTSPSGSGAPASTFKSETPPATDIRLKPIPDSSTGPASMSVPPLTPPNNRTTMSPVRQASYYSPIPWTPPASIPGPKATPAQPVVNEYEWHASPN